MRNLRAHLRSTPVLLGILALGLYLPGFWWGAPHATAADRVQSWGVDDGLPLQPLADVHNVLRPKPDRNLGYPLLQSLLVTAAYAPYLGWLWLTGQFAPATAYPFGLADPVAALHWLTLIGRFLSVLMGAGIVVAAYDGARALWDERMGVTAALVVMTLFPMFYYSRTGNPDVPVLFFTAATLAAFARILASGVTLRRAVALGAFVGLAAATKEQSAASFLALPPIVVVMQWRNTGGPGSREFWKPLVAGLAACVLLFGLGSGLFVDPQFFKAHLEFARSRMATMQESGDLFVRTFPRTWEGHMDLTKLLLRLLADTATPVGLLLGLLGVIWSSAREPRRALFVLPGATYFLVLFWVARAGQLRYVLPVAFTLAFFAARFLTVAMGARMRPARVAAMAAAVFVVGVGLLRGVDLTYAMMNDSRYTAAAWLAPRTPPGTRIEYFGESGLLPPLDGSVTTTRSAPYFGAVSRAQRDAAAVEAIRAGWRGRRPDFIILLPDHSSRPGEPYNFTCPPEVYRGLLAGEYGYRLAAMFETPPLLPWVRRPSLDYPSVNPPIRIFARPVGGASPEAR